MPIRVRNDLPVKERLEKENIFVMDEHRALHQDIRAIEIAILNLMPLKEDTELQILRELSNTPLQINVTFLMVSSHTARNVSKSHLDSFYRRFVDVKEERFDGLIVTGAPVEEMAFEEVDYWEEMQEILSWSSTNVTSTIYLCWAAQAAMYYFYGLQKTHLEKKIVGIFEHRVYNRRVPLVRGFDDIFMAPHSRYTEVPIDAIRQVPAITILADSKEAGLYLAMAENGRKIFAMGHPEYSRSTLRKEFDRDTEKGIADYFPVRYFPEDDPSNEPYLTWRAHANNLYTNWLNYYVYQTTPYALYGTPGGDSVD